MTFQTKPLKCLERKKSFKQTPPFSWELFPKRSKTAFLDVQLQNMKIFLKELLLFKTAATEISGLVTRGVIKA